MKRTQKLAKDWEYIFACHMFVKALKCIIPKELSKFNLTKENSHHLKRQKGLNR
jgi:hypothetical protein